MMLKVILSSVPFVWMIIALPFANRVHPYILGMPFLAFWIQLGVIVTVFCIHALYKMEQKEEHETKKLD
ncbi:MAG TPA: hypothetical protein DCS74_06115 [Veillonellaceae bacterium]|jgi:membrane protein implicated in regulation of membrane protease activity|nr:hypothetical protein [Veillonellaceae bacterium]